MSKGDRHRSISQDFKDRFENVKFNSESNTKKVEVTDGVRTKIIYGEPEKKMQVHHIMPDIEPYQPAGGSGAFKEVISSRSKEREYLRRNNCVQVGNEKEHFFKHGGKTEYNPTKDW